MWDVLGFGFPGVSWVGVACVFSVSLWAYDLLEVFVFSGWR